LATLGRLDEAATEFRGALKLDPALVAVWCTLGDALARSSRIDEAAASYEAALRRAPSAAAPVSGGRENPLGSGWGSRLWLDTDAR
jgi:cytochrome c-type biogenesis protein CcmH/NrfG